MTVNWTARETAYVVEQYLPNAAATDVEAFAIALHAAGVAISTEGHPVRLACSVLVPDDDLCLYVLKAASPEAAAQAAARAAITPERVMTAVAWLVP